jgi:hypothetical protein
MATLQEVLTHLTGHLGGTPTQIAWARDFTVVPRSLKPPATAFTFAQFTTSAAIPSRPDKDGSYRLSHVHVTVSMNRGRSWVVRGAQSTALLNHEQGHFTITWTVARDLCRQLLEMAWDATLLTATGVTDAAGFLRRQMNKAGQDAQKNADDLNALYDSPTGGAKNAAGVIVPAAQSNWDQMLAYSVTNDTAIPLLNSMLTSISATPSMWNNLPKATPPATTP